MKLDQSTGHDTSTLNQSKFDRRKFLQALGSFSLVSGALVSEAQANFNQLAQQTSKPQKLGFQSVVFSADGRYRVAVIGRGDRSERMLVTDRSTSSRVSISLERYQHSVKFDSTASVYILPDKSGLLLADNEGFHTYDWSGKLIDERFFFNSDFVTSTAVNFDGTVIASTILCEGEDQVELVDLQFGKFGCNCGQLVKLPKGFSAEGVQFNPTQNELLVYGRDFSTLDKVKILIFEHIAFDQYELKRSFNPELPGVKAEVIEAVRYTSDGKNLIVWSDQGICLCYDTSNGKELWRSSTPAPNIETADQLRIKTASLAVSADDKLIATVAGYGKWSIYLRNAKDGNLIEDFPVDQTTPPHLAFVPGKKQLLVTGGSRLNRIDLSKFEEYTKGE